MKKIKQELSTGTLVLNIDSNEWNAQDLFCFAERRNPKRSFLFLSKVLGKHVPISPKKMRLIYKSLALKINPSNKDGILFLGMAETAIGLACGIYSEASNKFTNTLLLTSTRHTLNSQLICEFKEEHSHATDHRIYLSSNSENLSAFKTLVLIDDESTTGNTFINLINSLLESDVINTNNIQEIITVVITDWSRDRLQRLNKTGIPIKTISLFTGDWHWLPNPLAKLPIMPNVNASSTGLATITPRQDWGRIGCVKHDCEDWLSKYSVNNAGESVLVLGSCEFLYPPFLLAEKLEKQGANVKFSSTTRSPISIGLGIKSSLAFSDNYGLGIANFCYNVAHERFDRIILCVETDIHFIDKNLIENLREISTKFEIAHYE